jgi:hypothetical protein
VHVVYELNWVQRLFITFEFESSSRVAYFLSVALAVTVLLDVLSFIVGVETVYTPSTCATPVCQNDPKLCPGKTVCEPIVPWYFQQIDIVSIYLFTFDYAMRVALCWTVSPRLAGLTFDALDRRGVGVDDRGDADIEFLDANAGDGARGVAARDKRGQPLMRHCAMLLRQAACWTCAFCWPRVQTLEQSGGWRCTGPVMAAISKSQRHSSARAARLLTCGAAC